MANPTNRQAQAAKAREALREKYSDPEAQAELQRKRTEGVKAAAVRRRRDAAMLEIVREYVPDLGAGVKAVLIILESERGDE